MFAILHSLGMFVADLFKPRCRLEAENLFLRHQLSIALRRAPPRLRLRGRTCGEFLLRMQRITTMSHTAYLSMSLIQKGWAADILVPWGATGVCERARRGSWFLRVRGSRV